MSTTAEQPAVLVTGGSGYLAGSVVVALLNAGHAVRTTIRDLAREGAVRATLGRYAPTDRSRSMQPTSWRTPAGLRP